MGPLLLRVEVVLTVPPSACAAQSRAYTPQTSLRASSVAGQMLFTGQKHSLCLSSSKRWKKEKDTCIWDAIIMLGTVLKLSSCKADVLFNGFSKPRHCNVFTIISWYVFSVLPWRQFLKLVVLRARKNSLFLTKFLQSSDLTNFQTCNFYLGILFFVITCYETQLQYTALLCTHSQQQARNGQSCGPPNQCSTSHNINNVLSFSWHIESLPNCRAVNTVPQNQREC